MAKFSYTHVLKTTEEMDAALRAAKTRTGVSMNQILNQAVALGLPKLFSKHPEIAHLVLEHELKVDPTQYQDLENLG